MPSVSAQSHGTMENLPMIETLILIIAVARMAMWLVNVPMLPKVLEMTGNASTVVKKGKYRRRCLCATC